VSLGWLLTIAVGQQTGWLGEVFLTRTCCLLCDQEEENIQHLLIGCVFARQFWYGLAALAPQPVDSSFNAWWDKAVLTVSGDA